MCGIVSTVAVCKVILLPLLRPLPPPLPLAPLFLSLSSPSSSLAPPSLILLLFSPEKPRFHFKPGDTCQSGHNGVSTRRTQGGCADNNRRWCGGEDLCTAGEEQGTGISHQTNHPWCQRNTKPSEGDQGRLRCEARSGGEC